MQDFKAMGTKPD